MGCFNIGTLTEEAKKADEMWTRPDKYKSAKILDRWGFGDDTGMLKKWFESATGKILEKGSKLEATDFRKMQLYIEENAGFLQDPGHLNSGDIFKRFYIGRAKGRKNPLLGEFYKNIRHASAYRTKHSHKMTSNFNDMINDFRDALIEYDGFSTAELKFKIPGVKRYMAGKVFGQLTAKEKKYVVNMKEGKTSSAASDFGNLMKYLNNEKPVFEDFRILVEEGTQGELKDKYEAYENKGIYSTTLHHAAASWKNIQEHGKKLVIDSLNQLAGENGILEMRFGKDNNFANKLIDEYKQMAKSLSESKEGYIPHYVLDVFATVNEMRERMAEVKSPNEMEPYIKQYINDIKKVNFSLTGRLRSRSKEKSEYFSRNPLLYADKYVAEVIRFNHSTFIDKAYLQGLKQFSQVMFNNPGKKEAKAAEVYKDVMDDLFKDAKGMYGKEASQSYKNLDATVNANYYFSKIGASSRSPLRNLSQRAHHLTVFGLKEWNEARKMKSQNDDYKTILEAEKDKHGFQFQDIGKVTEGALDQQDFMAMGVEYRDGMLGKNDKNAIGNKIAKWSQKLATSSAKNFNIPLLEKISMESIEFGNRSNGFDLAFYHKWKQLLNTDKYRDLVLTKGKEGYHDNRVEDVARQAGYYADNVVEFIHGDYSTPGKADIIKKGVGRFGFKFMHYRMFFLDFMHKLYKDAYRSVKAGDFTGDQVQRFLYLGGIQVVSEVASIVSNWNITSYLGNELIEWVKDFSKLFDEDPEVRGEAFYGGGLPSAVGAVPINDFTSIFNAGVAAGYWNHFIDPESRLGELIGFRDMDHMNDQEFKEEALGTAWVQGARSVNTFQTFSKFGFWPAIRHEYGLFPGQTQMGMDTRKVRKKIQETESYKKISEAYEKSFGLSLMPKEGKKSTGLTDQQRRQALASMAGL
mgnify:FL=1